MIALFVPLFLLILALAVGWVLALRARHAAEREFAAAQATLWRAQRSEQLALERLHAVSNSALQGWPAVKWQRPQPVPGGADAYYWRIRIAGEELLLTDEQFRTARQRADHLLHSAATH